MTEAEVTGAPSKMAANRADLTPMMTQYLDLCEAYPDSLVLFQVGDFYETFCEAAEETARVLEITLTAREDSSGEYAMSGIPIDDAPSYVETLLERGYRVAVADQVQDPEEATGVVDRAVTRVVTPGTVTDDELLAADANYVACATRGDGNGSRNGNGNGSRNGDRDGGSDFGVAFVDVSTGEFLATGVSDEGALIEELDRYDPAELVVGPDCDPDFEFDGMLTEHDPEAFAAAAARETLREHVGTPDALLESESEVRACGGLLAYVEYTQGGGDGDLGHVDRVRRYDPREYLGLDRTALRSLEVFENREGGDEHTLFGVLGDTASALGRRELTEWLRHPLVREADIEARLDAVEEWTERSLSREEARDALTEVYDLERLLTRVSRGRANARDLRSLKDTLDAVPQVRAALADANAAKLRSLRESLDELEDVRGLIGRAVESDPPQEVTEGDVIKTGFDEDLDALRETEREGRAWVADLEERERERTGIDSLEVGYNEVHGYYIEVTNPNLDRVPQDYTRRQTLKNSERFYTPELKEREDEILGAAERADSLEYDLFREVRSDVAAAAERISATADALSELDALATLAAAAVQYDYARPEFGDGGIEIRRGRHPVVERVESDFVPNDTDLTEERQAIITGPNMSGKSTYMRQVALICLLAQAGSFVPAAEARLPILDRVFTRVGASDDIAGGQSTFMREMAELTTILHAATADSLILLDEVGRGTSTADGLAIARAVTEFVHDEVGAYTLFATHYHGLTDLAAGLPDLCNLHFGADRRDGGVTFRHEVERGASSSSYGVEVARMAGVPDPVVERAHELLAERAEPGGGGQPTPGAEPSPDDTGDADCTDETGVEANGDGTGSERVTGAEGTSESRGESEDADLPAEVLRRLRGADLARTTPLEALQELDDLKRLVEGTDAEAGVGVEAEAEAEADADD